MELGHEVRVLDDLSAGSLDNVRRWLDNGRFESIKGDMRNLEIVKDAVKDVEAVFHLAANPEVRIGSQSPELLYETNVLITYNLLNAMRIRVRNTSSSRAPRRSTVMPRLYQLPRTTPPSSP
ncbi:hypothetical protein JCM16307_18840 [Thermococcus prieurii]